MLQKIVLRDNLKSRWLVFDRPEQVLCAETPSDVLKVLAKVERQVNDEGLFAAGYVSYEAAAGFDAALTTRPQGRLPLLCFGLFAEPASPSRLPPLSTSAHATARWQMTTTRDTYLDKLDEIKTQIELGNSYQINYTVRQRAEGMVDPWSLFFDIAGDAPYAAYLEFENYAIVSASPELFFSLDADQLLCRPMKGTAARGMTSVDDRAIQAELQNSPKNRAENVMITDMLRNDTGRIAVPGSVKVTSLFDIEKYPTLWQMTSTVTATTSAPITEIFRALFPCASVTGAPKAASMALIAQLEDSPREVYTGAIGFFGPDRQAQFSVAIRTAWLDKQRREATYGVGGGIVWDSDPEDEYRECLIKARVLTTAAQDRDFQLLETLRWTAEDGYFLLEYHLNRLRDSADYFNFKFDIEAIGRALTRLASGLMGDRYRVRLLLARNGDTNLSETSLATDEHAAPLRIRLAAEPIDVTNPLLYHKTTQRRIYEQALQLVGDCDDVLLWNADGYITETSIANVVVRLDGDLVTPPVVCGLLAGTYRQWLLDRGEIKERKIHLGDLAAVDGLTLTNSVRGAYDAFL
jgi:para-aminobenzoate synthetase/4-amino-4-deoxychorismate lyase